MTEEKLPGEDIVGGVDDELPEDEQVDDAVPVDEDEFDEDDKPEEQEAAEG